MDSEPRRDLPVPLRVDVRRPDGTTTVEYAVNISPGGLCLHLERALSRGDPVHLEFTLPPSGPVVRADANVVWIKEEEAVGVEGRFCETGVEFSDVEASIAEKLLAYASQPIDRRR
jgi:hypothetical protein